MIGRIRRLGALTCAIALLVPLASAPAAAAAPCRVEGRVLGVDGRPAAGHSVILLERSGTVAARAETAPDGAYALTEVPAGTYALGVEAPDGRVAPVAGPPAELAEGAFLRRDVKLVEVGEATPRLAPAAYGYTSGGWWAGLSRTARIWTIVGIVVGSAAIVAAVSNGGGGEQPASPSK